MADFRTTDAAAESWKGEVDSGHRFEFGHNWALFLRKLSEDRIIAAERSLLTMLNLSSLAGLSFLDVGSGSGLFSLAARRLGAKVTSFDFDAQSFACTRDLRQRFFPEDADWNVLQGSVLDRGFLSRLGDYNIVYSWGVLHHTGAMWEALDNVAQHVKSNGRLYVAIYNDQGRASRSWMRVKRAYVRVPKALRWVITIPASISLWGPTMVRDMLRLRPFESWRNYGQQSVRGMDARRDLIDWIGGYPFEVAKPEEIFEFYKERGFLLDRMTTCAGGIGCNEFAFYADLKRQSGL